VLGQEEDYMGVVLAELERTLEEAPAPQLAGLERTVLDRRGESLLAVLADAVMADGAVLAVCADIPRRLEGLRSRCGGFSLISYEALERDPSSLRSAEHLVALDPPSSETQSRLARGGEGFTHLAWGEAELRFAQHMHELEYGLRGSLTALYRALRALGRAAGADVERVLKGDGAYARSPRLGGRLVRVLSELELARLDPAMPALAVMDGPRTSLERSPAYRAYAKRYEDGRLFLSSASLLPGG
jgi:hypothetical protein